MASLIETLNSKAGGSKGGKREACRKEIVQAFEKDKTLKMFEMTNVWTDKHFNYTNSASRTIAKRGLAEGFSKHCQGYMGFKIGIVYGVVKVDRLEKEELEYVKNNNVLGR